MYNWINRWLFSTNHKDIGKLYLIFSLVVGIIVTMLDCSVILADESVDPTMESESNSNFTNYIKNFNMDLVTLNLKLFINSILNIEITYTLVILLFFILCLSGKHFFFFLSKREIGFNWLEHHFKNKDIEYILSFIFVIKILNIEALMQFCFAKFLLPLYIWRTRTYFKLSKFKKIQKIYSYIFVDGLYNFTYYSVFLTLPITNMFRGVHRMSGLKKIDKIFTILMSGIGVYIWIWVLEIEVKRIFILLLFMYTQLFLYALLTSMFESMQKFTVSDGTYFIDSYFRKFILTRLLTNKKIATKLMDLIINKYKMPHIREDRTYECGLSYRWSVLDSFLYLREDGICFLVYDYLFLEAGDIENYLVGRLTKKQLKKFANEVGNNFFHTVYTEEELDQIREWMKKNNI